MQKTILITGSTDGIGLHAAEKFAALGHFVLLHGRNEQKLKSLLQDLRKKYPQTNIAGFCADLSDLTQIEKLAAEITDKFSKIDILINNAGVYKTDKPKTAQGYDVRFIVNTVAPYLLSQKLLKTIPNGGRIINLSSAAQAPIDLNAFMNKIIFNDQMAAYAQTKLGILSWSIYLADKLKEKQITVIPVNPASLLATKMVREGFNTAGSDINIGSDVLLKLALEPEIANHSGEYFDNDAKKFSVVPPAASDPTNIAKLIKALDSAGKGF